MKRKQEGQAVEEAGSEGRKDNAENVITCERHCETSDRRNRHRQTDCRQTGRQETDTETETGR